MNKEQFFIGWSGNVSSEHKKWFRRLLIPIFVTIPLIIFAIVFFTKPFGDGMFEFGKVKEFTGVYYEDPFPVFILDEGQLETGTDPQALLVGFGKNGTKTFMRKAEEKKGKLSGKRLKIQGTLIYGDGKTLIELTKKEDSVLEVMESQIPKNQKPQLTNQTLRGEILDPKCWFGVMKPAEGKVHKSCAIRCISGGIPPVFREKSSGGNKYYILKGANGEDINQEILEYVGEGVDVKGQSYSENGWSILRVDPKSINYPD